MLENPMLTQATRDECGGLRCNSCGSYLMDIEGGDECPRGCDIMERAAAEMDAIWERFDVDYGRYVPDSGAVQHYRVFLQVLIDLRKSMERHSRMFGAMAPGGKR